jgi:hypothetical protein
VFVMWRRAGEDNAVPHARWRAEHPHQPANVIIVRWAEPGDGAPR